MVGKRSIQLINLLGRIGKLCKLCWRLADEEASLEKPMAPVVEFAPQKLAAAVEGNLVAWYSHQALLPGFRLRSNRDAKLISCDQAGSPGIAIRLRFSTKTVDRRLDEIKSVTYKVWSDFPQDKYKTEKVGSSFDLWLRVYGEFPVIALVELKTGEQIVLQRYLDLPSRPPD